MSSEKSEELVKMLHHLKRMIGKLRPSAKIPHGEFIMLIMIERALYENENNHTEQPGVMVSQIAQRLNSTKPATSKMLSVMEEKGYIERIMDKTDRRAVYIRLTQSGQTILDNAKESMSQFADHVIEQMGEKESEEFLRLLGRFIDVIENETEKKKG